MKSTEFVNLVVLLSSSGLFERVYQVSFVQDSAGGLFKR